MDKQTILQAVSEVTGVNKELILSPNKTIRARYGWTVFARYLSISFCNKYFPGDVRGIKKFHNRDRSFFYHAIKTLKNDIDTDPFRLAIYQETHKRLTDIEPIIPTTEDFSDDEYQDLTSEALSFQTNATV
jgi:hypothetical protein